MTVDEFDLVVNSAGLVNDLLNSREIPMFFNLGMMIQVNEVDLDRHLQATYIEFLEAVARVCDEASIVAAKSDKDDNDSLHTIISEEERRSLPLHIKIENALPYFINYCTNKAFSEKFEMPKKDPIIGLYILPNKKFF